MATDRSYIDLSTRVAIVTGGGNGIGRGIAMRLATVGADVAIVDIDQTAAASVAKEAEALGVRAIAVKADVVDQSSTDAMAEAVLGDFGRIDILVNNAGIGGAAGWTDRGDASTEDWSAVFEVNVLGIVHASNSVMSHMMERRSGKIVNIASIAGRRGSPGFAHYSASKASAINVTQAFAYQLAPYTINVNSVCPGVLWTELMQNIWKRKLSLTGNSEAVGRRHFEDRLGAVPLGREQTPEDIGNAVAFLASDRAKSITGQALNVDGGSVMN